MPQGNDVAPLELQLLSAPEQRIGRGRYIHNILENEEWQPITGWPLAMLGQIAISSGVPQLLLFASRSRPRWRQAVFLALAMHAFEAPDLFLKRIGAGARKRRYALRDVAHLLPTLSPAQIIDGCFDEVPPGLPALLRKLDGTPLREDTYRTLVAWHRSQPSERARAEVLQKMVQLHQGKVDAVEALDDALMMPAVLTLLSTTSDAEHLNRVLRTIRTLCSGATKDALRTSARELQGSTTVRSWAETWLRQADQLHAPVFQADPDWRPLTTAAAILDTARRFKNCLASRYMSSLLSGKVAAVEYLPRPVLTLLAPMSDGGWLIVSTHAPGNRPVDESLDKHVREKLLSYGQHVRAMRPRNSEIASVTDKIFGDFEPFDIEWLAVEP